MSFELGEKTKQKQNPDLQHMIRRQISRISTANQQYNDIFQSTKETANIITGVASPSGAHGQGTVSRPHTNGIILVGGGGGGLDIVHPVHPRATPLNINPFIDFIYWSVFHFAIV